VPYLCREKVGAVVGLGRQRAQAGYWSTLRANVGNNPLVSRGDALPRVPSDESCAERDPIGRPYRSFIYPCRIWLRGKGFNIRHPVEFVRRRIRMKAGRNLACCWKDSGFARPASAPAASCRWPWPWWCSRCEAFLRSPKNAQRRSGNLCPARTAGTPSPP